MSVLKQSKCTSAYQLSLKSVAVIQLRSHILLVSSSETIVIAKKQSVDQFFMPHSVVHYYNEPRMTRAVIIFYSYSCPSA